MQKKYTYIIVFGALLMGIYDRGLAQNNQCKTACFFDSIARSPVDLPLIWSPDGTKYVTYKQDSANVYQIYIGNKGDTNLSCISLNGPNIPQYTPWNQKNKLQVGWHPSGKWITCQVEKDILPFDIWLLKQVSYDAFLALLYTGVWSDIWITDTTGSQWYQLADTKNGFTGVAFTRDGKLGAWAEAQDTSLPSDAFGYWRLQLSQFSDSGGVPRFASTQDINPIGSRWIEPGNFAPDGKSLLISSDIGLPNAQGQDQFILDITTGAYINLTNSPQIWDEHGLFSPDGKKILFMSSYPYRADTNTYHTFGVITEFMLMDAVYPGEVPPCNDSIYYPGIEQLTHFNVQGYPESDSIQGVAVVPLWFRDGSGFNGAKNYGAFFSFWNIYFEGNCGMTPVSIAQTSGASTICSGESVVFTATDSSVGPTYQWAVNGYPVFGASDSIFTTNALPPGADTVTCIMNQYLSGLSLVINPDTSNGVPITVNAPVTPSVNIQADSEVICSGAEVTFAATPTNGGAVPFYQWKNNDTAINGATGSTYSSTALANGDVITVEMTSDTTCLTNATAVSNAITITVNALPEASITILNDTLIASPATTYQWYENNAVIANAISQTYVATNNGSYSVVVTDASGCQNSAIINYVTGIKDISPLSNMKIYPNPNDGKLFIDLSSSLTGGQVALMVYDMSGQMLLTNENTMSDGGIISLNVQNLAGGIYLLQVSNSRDIAYRKLIVVNKG